jgi:hypothetical protein
MERPAFRQALEIAQGVVTSMDQSIVSDLIPVMINLCISGIGILISIASISISFYTARKYGDLAGTIKIIEYEKEKAVEIRRSALRSLINETERIRKLVNHNSQLTPASSSNPPVRVPTSAFETAFVSGSTNIAASERVLDTAAEYLVHADRINVLIEVYVSGVPSGEGTTKARMREAVKEIERLCQRSLGDIVDNLQEALRTELRSACSC